MSSASFDDFAESGIRFGVVGVGADRTFTKKFRMICYRSKVERSIDFYGAGSSTLPVERRYANGLPKRIAIGVIGAQPHIETEGITRQGGMDVEISKKKASGAYIEHIPGRHRRCPRIR